MPSAWGYPTNPTTGSSSYGGGFGTSTSSSSRGTTRGSGVLPSGGSTSGASYSTLPTFPSLFGSQGTSVGSSSQVPWNRVYSNPASTYPAYQPPPATPYSYNVPAMTSNVQANPQLQQVYQQTQDYRSQLAGNTDQDAILAMQRLRDLQSGQRSEIEQNAAQRGLDPSSGASQYLQSRAASQGQRTQAGLNADLASGGRSLQLAALGQAGGTAGAMAGNLLGQQQYALNQWQAQQQAAQAQANLQLASQNQGYNQMYGMANLQMQALQPLLHAYTGY